MTIADYGRDFEIVRHMKPEPMTAGEQAAQALVGDVEFEIFKHKLHMIALEGKETTMKLGASTAMRWGDVAFGIFTAQGDLALCATGIYHHAVLAQIPIKYIVKHWTGEPSVGIRDGDSFFYNDPFYAGVHNADMGLAIPVFDGDRLLCFVGAVVHTGESGAKTPGGMCTTAESKYDEGLLVPPIKIGEKYRLREDILTMLSAMTRDPRTMILDIKARLAATRTAQRRIVDFVADQGADFFVGALRRLLAVTGEAARKKIAALNDGVYRQPRFLDSVGSASGLVKINLSVTKRGNRLILDFTNSSPMVEGQPMNSFYQGIIGLCMVYFCGWFFHDLPANNGLLEALDWRFPEDAVVNARGDVSTSLAPVAQVCFTQGMFMCGAHMMYAHDPERAVAAWFTGFAITIFGGVNQLGEPIADITPEINATGAGARPDMDGVDGAGAFFATVSDCSDVESTEADRPFLYTFRNFFNGSYGHGKYRGGAGVGFGLKVHHVPAVGLGGMGAGARFPMTLGIFGGTAGPPTFIQTVTGSNLDALLAASDPALPRDLGELYGDTNPERGARVRRDINMAVEAVKNGDTFYLAEGGGAGYGDAIERDADAVMADLRERRVTDRAAREIYHVVYDPASLRVDEAATRARRRQVMDERKRRGRPYAEFEAEWLRLRPPEQVLRYYGSYPDPDKRQRA